VPLTVIIPVRNEEKNIAECLDSVTWADQVFVVDSQSIDRTEVIAREHGAEVVQFNYDGGWPKKKNWAIRSLPIRNEWFLILDADERVDDDLRREIEQAIQQKDIDGYYIRWKFIFLGRWMKHCWQHGWMLRLVRSGKGEYEDLGMRAEGGWDNEVHENIVVQGKTAKLKSWLIHDSNQSLSYWIAKQNEFSDWNAVRRQKQLADGIPKVASVLSGDPVRRRKLLKAVYLRLPLKPVWLFFYLYVFKLGLLDGKAGFYFCALRATHELTVEAKFFERSFRE
jgi:glycosyltransferase involved in cell wall biosynthesis